MRTRLTWFVGVLAGGAAGLTVLSLGLGQEQPATPAPAAAQRPAEAKRPARDLGKLSSFQRQMLLSAQARRRPASACQPTRWSLRLWLCARPGHSSGGRPLPAPGGGRLCPGPRGPLPRRRPRGRRRPPGRAHAAARYDHRRGPGTARSPHHAALDPGQPSRRRRAAGPDHQRVSRAGRRPAGPVRPAVQLPPPPAAAPMARSASATTPPTPGPEPTIPRASTTIPAKPCTA